MGSRAIGKKQQLGLYAPLEVSMYPDEDPLAALLRLGVHIMGMPEFVVTQHFSKAEFTPTWSLEERVIFPGLPTALKTYRFKVRFPDPQDENLCCVGLPSGCDFLTSTPSPVIGHSKTILTWVSAAEFECHTSQWQGREVQVADVESEVQVAAMEQSFKTSRGKDWCGICPKRKNN